jgi:SAM-dependent methyltransferase
LVSDVPILVDSATSVFRAEDIAAAAVLSRPVRPGLRARLLGMVPFASPSRNLAAAVNLQRFADLVPDGTVLVIGGGRRGEGFASLDGRVEIVSTDVYVSDEVDVACDAHNLPFADGSFDGVVCQAVLEHVLDPQQVVAEIHRVLRPGGVVYSEVPFMQQVHEGAHDFTRYTLLGHRRLYRFFEELDSGPVGGPGMALAWSVIYFVTAAARPGLIATLAGRVASWAVFWLKRLDGFLAVRPGGVDAAAATFFLGARAEAALEDRELLRSYRGAVPSPAVSYGTEPAAEAAT